MTKKEETNDIIQLLIPTLESLKINKEYCKIDVTTEKSQTLRGDIWISTKKQESKDFENNIIALIEAKHKNSIIGDMNWLDAMKQGKIKSLKQHLNYYIVTNCLSDFRYYNSYTDDEITLDDKVITKLYGIDILNKIQTQASIDNNDVINEIKKNINEFTEPQFRNSLKVLEDIYRSAGLKDGDDRIDPTVSFVVLKYISEQEKEKRTLDIKINLWDKFLDIVNEVEVRDLSAEFSNTVNQIWGENSNYKDNKYKDFKDLIKFPNCLNHEHFKLIYKELNKYHFHGGAKFDLFGTIYEMMATSAKKKEFGEFYTGRHITSVVSRLLLRNENIPRDLKICDPACGTGGFLTEAYKTLYNNYDKNNKLDTKVKNNLKETTFWGFDKDEKSVARTKINMFLIGDGHTHIYQNDSLIQFNNQIEWDENSFDYILANPPMGTYKGDADITKFNFTNEKRFELMFIEKIIKAVKYGGEVAVIINDGALESPSRKSFRLKLLENCDINAIISLTKFEFAPYTKEKTYILIMQKKQEQNVGIIQTHPIWHYIVDFDGFANSDKRYRTLYHNDLQELENIYIGAVELSKHYNKHKEYFENKKGEFERYVNDKEIIKGLTGMKFGYSLMQDINETNFFNLLSEYYLRPFRSNKITLDQLELEYKDIVKSFKDILFDEAL